MNDIDLHEQLRDLSLSIYKDDKKLRSKDWIDFSTSENKKNGFYAQAFYKNGKIVIVYRGTDLDKGVDEAVKDLKNDYDMYKKRFPEQKDDALKFYEKIKKQNPNTEIIVIGQSLGGSLAQHISNITNCKAVTFNAYGIADQLNGNIRNTDNIINYGNVNDIIFNKNLENQLGKTFLLNTKNEGDYYSKFNSNELNKDLRPFKYHNDKGLKDLKNAVLYEPARLYGYVEHKVPLPQTEIMADNTNSDIILKSVLDEIAPELSRYFDPQTGEADIMRNTSGEVYVHPYTRDDGTDVRGYYRSLPDKI